MSSLQTPDVNPASTVAEALSEKEKTSLKKNPRRIKAMMTIK